MKEIEVLVSQVLREMAVEKKPRSTSASYYIPLSLKEKVEQVAEDVGCKPGKVVRIALERFFSEGKA